MTMLSFRVEDREAEEAQRIGSVVVAALTRARRGLVSELELTPADGVPTESVVNFDNIHSIPRRTFRRRVATLSPARMAEVCRTLQAATGC
jgi:mRNA interferase MazF